MPYRTPETVSICPGSGTRPLQYMQAELCPAMRWAVCPVCTIQYQVTKSERMRRHRYLTGKALVTRMKLDVAMGRV